MPLQSSDVDLGQIEVLVKKHFGSEFTCCLTRDHASGRYVTGEGPDVIARPRKVFFLTLGYEVIGQFRDEHGDVLEYYRDTNAAAARAFVEEYRRTVHRDLQLHVLD
ncbi:MAG: hypothetical protein ACE5IQ_12665 [Candidatus Methylomirabilales bacterium]